MMITVFKRVIFFILINVLLLSLCGCWGKNELNEIGIVTAIGLDLDEKNNIKLTVIAVSPVSAPTGAVLERSTSWVGTAMADNIADASRQIRSITAKKLVFHHTSIILISEKLARYGLKDIVDFFARSREIRLSTKVLITDKSVEEMLLIPSDIEKNLPSEINGIISNSKDEWSKSLASDLKEIIACIANKNKGAITGKLSFIDTERNSYSTNREMYKRSYQEGLKLGIAFLEGSAVFKDDHMQGWMDGNETRGFLWIKGKVDSATVTFKNPQGARLVSMKVKASTSKIIPIIKNNKISFKVKNAD